MTNIDRAKLEKCLMRKNYQAIDEALRSLSPSDLLSLLDSKSIKIGDTAASLLNRRKETALLIDALLNDRIRTALGRVRATNVLNWHGRAVPAATTAQIHCLDDRSDSVIRNALFGIVFLRRRDLIPKLKERLAVAERGSRRQLDFREAIKALEANDPLLFSPGFDDAGNVWRLDDPV